MYKEAPREEWMVRKTSSQLSTDLFLSFFLAEKHTYLRDPTSQKKPALSEAGYLRTEIHM
jgi:hypothetical protein